MLIRVKDLSYTYAPGTPLARTALHDINLEVRGGERVGIAGPSGSGKSTLAQLLAGLLEPTSGAVWLDGAAAHGHAAAARAQRGRTGLALQQPEDQIFEQSVFREVAFGPRNMRLDAAEIAGRVQWALEMAGLDPVAMQDRVPFILSGGEMRRVALAGILAMRPDVLILDEPTAGLDPRGRRELLDRLGNWQAETGMTLIVVSHHLEELGRIADRIVLLGRGAVVADGPVNSVLSDSRLLRSMGLDVPEPVTLLQILRKAGWQVRTDLLLPEPVAAEIEQARGVLEAIP
jgi:energy-coupling factor transport system ATP-binding protein